VLGLAQCAIDIAGQTGDIDGNNSEFTRKFQQCQIPDIGAQARVLMCVGKHDVLNHEFNIHHPPAVMFDVEQAAVVGMAIVHLTPHRQYLGAQQRRIARLAKATGRSPHNLMIEALEREVTRVEKMKAFVQAALAAKADIEAGGAVYRADDVHAWMERLAKGEKPPRPAPWRR